MNRTVSSAFVDMCYLFFFSLSSTWLVYFPIRDTHTYIYIYIGSGKRAYSALPPFYSPYTASIGDYQRSINRVATFPTFLARYSTVLTTVELEQARFPRSVYLRQTDLGKSWPRIKLIGIRRSLFNVIGEEGERKKKGNEVTSR